MSVPEEEKNPYSKTLRHRIARNAGHLNTVKKMIDDGMPFDKVMIQLSAVRASLTSISNKLMAEHVDRAIQDAVKSGDMTNIAEVYQSVEKYFGK